MWSIWNFSPHFLDGLCICLLLTWSNQIPFLKMTVLTTVLDWWLPFGLHRLPPNTIPSSSLNPFLIIILAHAKFVVMTFKYNCLDWVLSDLKLCSPVFEDNHWIYIWLANLSPWGHGGKSPKNLKKKNQTKDFITGGMIYCIPGYRRTKGHGDRTVEAATEWNHVGVWAQIARVSSFSKDTQTL